MPCSPVYRLPLWLGGPVTMHLRFCSAACLTLTVLTSAVSGPLSEGGARSGFPEAQPENMQAQRRP